MDDTALGRPARHQRPSTSRREPRPVGEVSSAGAGVSGEVTCAGCGATFALELPPGTFAVLVRIARRQLSGEVDAYCSDCGDARERAEDEAEVAEQRDAARERRLLGSGIPARWRAQRFAQLDTDAPRAEAIREAKAWGAGARRRGLLLWGEVGRGKTAIAAAAAVMRLEIGMVRWLSVADLLLNLRMPFDSAEYAAAQRALDATRGARALVLDDLDKVKPTDHSLQPIYVAVNGWLEADLPLLVTCNRDLDVLAEDFGDRFGEPIASRLAGHCRVHEVGGVDRRVVTS